MPDESSTSSTPRCATAPSARASPTRWPTSSPSPGCSTSSASASSRAAGRARCPRTPSSSPAPPTASWRSSTRCWSRSAPPARPASQAEDDPQVRALLDSRAAVVTLVAKSSSGTSSGPCAPRCEENLAMVRDTVAFLRAEGRRVFLDCEHFFDGYRLDRDYGVRVLDAAAEAGADVGRHCATRTAACCRWTSHEVVTDVAAHRHPARHPHPGRHRLRGGQHAWPPWPPGRPTPRARPTATASGPATPTSSRVIGGLVTKMGLRRAARRLPGRDAAGLARHRRDRQPGPGHPRALRRRAAFAHKAGLHASAIKVRPRCTTTSTRRGRQRPAHPGHRDGRPGVGRAQVAAARR